MWRIYSCRIVFSVFFSFLNYGGEINAQIIGRCSIGEISEFSIIQTEDCIYSWQLFSGTNTGTKVSSEQVQLLTNLKEKDLKVKWMKQGDFLITVTVINQNGCTNLKGMLFNVYPDHLLKANNDYIKSFWSDTTRIEPVKNDIDTNNDIDIQSIKITTPPRLGKVTVDPDGSIFYSSGQIKACDDYFDYEICDTFHNCSKATVFVFLSDPPIYPVEGISPNQDGKNDYFKIRGIEAFPNSTIKIFNRAGQIVYSSNNYKNEWEGRQGKDSRMFRLVPTGVYYYVLKLGRTNRFFKGFVYVAY